MSLLLRGRNGPHLALNANWKQKQQSEPRQSHLSLLSTYIQKQSFSVPFKRETSSAPRLE
jgi:hypothetical protein